MEAPKDSGAFKKAQFEKYILLFRSRNVLYVKRVFGLTITRSAIQRTKDARHRVETNLFHLATLPFKDVALTVMV